MFFIVDKPRFEKILRIVRPAPGVRASDHTGPFLRIEASDNRLSLSSRSVSAEFEATVFEPGVLFLRERLFARLLRGVKGENQLSIQVNAEGLLFSDVRMPLEPNLMLLYINPLKAPVRHPEEVHAERKSLREEVEQARVRLSEAEQTCEQANTDRLSAEKRLQTFDDQHPEPPPDALFGS